MAGRGEAGPRSVRKSAVMHAQAFHNRTLGKVVTVRPLANGDTATVAALFDRLSPASRERRYHAAKPRLTSGELARLAQVGPDSHVVLAPVDRDPLPAGLARLVPDPMGAVGSRPSLEWPTASVRERALLACRDTPSLNADRGKRPSSADCAFREDTTVGIDLALPG